MTQAAPPRQLVRRLLGYTIDMAADWLVVAAVFATTHCPGQNQFSGTTPKEPSHRPSSQFGIPTALRLTWVKDTSDVKQPTRSKLTSFAPPLNFAGLLCVIGLIVTTALPLQLRRTKLGMVLMRLKFSPPQPLRRKALCFIPNNSAELTRIRPSHA